jgi:hypothetical protein
VYNSIKKILFIILILVSDVFSAEFIDLYGTVTDSAGKAVSDVELILANRNLRAMTNNDGVFRLTNRTLQTHSILKENRKEKTTAITFINGKFPVNSLIQGYTSVFDIQGRLVYKTAGETGDEFKRKSFNSNKPECGVYILKYQSSAGIQPNTTETNQDKKTLLASKNTAALDTLIFLLNNLNVMSMPLNSLVDTIDLVVPVNNFCLVVTCINSLFDTVNCSGVFGSIEAWASPGICYVKKAVKDSLWIYVPPSKNNKDYRHFYFGAYLLPSTRLVCDMQVNDLLYPGTNKYVNLIVDPSNPPPPLNPPVFIKYEAMTDSTIRIIYNTNNTEDCFYCFLNYSFKRDDGYNRTIQTDQHSTGALYLDDVKHYKGKYHQYTAVATNKCGHKSPVTTFSIQRYNQLCQK